MWKTVTTPQIKILLPTSQELQGALSPASVKKSRSLELPDHPIRRTGLILPYLRNPITGEVHILLLGINRMLESIGAFDISFIQSIGPSLMHCMLENAEEKFRNFHQGYFNRSQEKLSWNLVPAVNIDDDWSCLLALVDFESLSATFNPLTLSDEFRYNQLIGANQVDAPESSADDNTTPNHNHHDHASLHWIPLKLATSNLTMQDPILQSQTKYLGIFELDPLLRAALSLPSLVKHLDRFCDSGAMPNAEVEGVYGALEHRSMRTHSKAAGLRKLRVLPRSTQTLSEEFWKSVV